VPEAPELAAIRQPVMQDPVEQQRMHPVIVRRLDDMCRVVEV
jgi:hypothetical protein